MLRSLLRFLAHHSVRSYAPAGHTGFAIIFLPRTGSNLLAGMLDSHPDIICHHEVFNPDAVHRSLTYKHTSLSFGTVAERDADPFAFLSRVYSFSDGRRAVGFKIAPRQNDLALLSLLLCRRIRKILLHRRNHLHAYTSFLIAHQTRVWSVPTVAADPAAPRPLVSVDFAGLRRFARRRDAFHRLARTILQLTGQSFATVDYEAIGHPETMRHLLAFLGVRHDVRLAERTVRQNPPRLRDRIANYDAIATLLAGTPMAAWLDPEQTTGITANAGSSPP